MIKDITLGQFFPGSSLLHRLDPRTKLVVSIVYIVAIFMAQSYVAYALLALSAVVLVLVSRISVRVILKGLKPIVAVLLFTFVLNLFFAAGKSGEAPLFELGFLHIYKSGIIHASLMSVRIVILILSTSVFLTYTTSPIRLTDGIESLLKPLEKVRVPVHVFAMLMTIALRFIPTFVEETDKIMSAQKARGADFSSGGLIKRARALLPILIPLILSALRRADDLATAMECRCYRGGDGRTKMTALRYRLSDLWFFLLSAAFLSGIILINIYLPWGIV